MELQNKNQEEIIQLVGFKLGDEEFGIDISRVQEINMMMQLTKIPNSNKFIEGVVNLRGKIVPVINLRERLGLANKATDSKTKIIVSDINNALIGFIVDEVKEVLRIAKSIVEPAPDIVTGGIEAELIEGVAKLDGRILILLNLEKLLTQKDMGAINEVENNLKEELKHELV